ncbi:MAG: hypothetical protein AAF152_08085 [Cyanobacteria bacterium P01_A01_bin.114]
MTLSPLQRLQVNDGMLITADHWQIAHSYHQQRQTIHYGSLHQGGVVSGLGVSVGPIPEAAPSKYRQPRWLTIQPGLAIDAQGNPIVVAQPESCYLSAQPAEDTTIYIVLKHSERSSQADIVQEAFQILEKDVPAASDEIELCRVRMTAGMDAIAPPEDVFSPAANQLDLRHRQPVQPRPHITARVASWLRRRESMSQFEAMFEALPSLYPALRGQVISQPLKSDLSHLTYPDFCQLARTEQHRLALYLKRGGVVLVEAPAGSLGDLYQIETELRVTAKHKATTPALEASVEQELTELRSCITDAVAQLTAPVESFVETERLASPDAGKLAADHPIRSHPFRFGSLPTLYGQPIGLYGWGGLLLLVGPLPQAWGHCCDLPRDEIRSAQELGVNLLNFAAHRRQMHQWLAPSNTP